MGFFNDPIGSISGSAQSLASSPLGELGLSAIPGVGSFLGAQNTNATSQQINSANNDFNAQQAQLNRDFQANQSATAIQTRVADLKAAGLNPAQAYTSSGGQGAQSMSGSQASSSGLPHLVNPLEGGGLSNIVPSIMDAYNKLTQADATSAQADLTRAQTAGAGMSPQVLSAQIQEINSRADLNSAQKDLAIKQKITEAIRPDLVKSETASNQVGSGLKRAETTGQMTENQLKSNLLPESSNQAAIHDSLWGKFWDWTEKMFSSAGSVVGAAKGTSALPYESNSTTNFKR